MSMKYTITQSRLLYVLSINDRKHANLLKVGEVFVDNEIADDTNKQVLFKAVRDILDKRSYMQGVNYHLEHVECTTYNQSTKCYKADDVYRTLNKMGIPSTTLNKFKSELFPAKAEDADIWFHCFLAEIQEAINKIKFWLKYKKPSTRLRMVKSLVMELSSSVQSRIWLLVIL